ncbi:MAG: hypothetical protein P8P36_02705 [Akkermansiaceae bacterium]|nr:hypothetical protein [Akkermansiaceae bacterium]
MKRHNDQAPDPADLTLWMDGELDGDELARVEAWVKDHPECTAEREAIHAMQSEIRANIPASIDPPHADFFNQRILRAIENDRLDVPAREVASGHTVIGVMTSKFGKWLAVPTAAVAMLLCFYMGTQVSQVSDPVAPIVKVSAKPAIYMSDGNVRANILSPDHNGATVIVLEGLDDIPDDFELVGEPQRSRSARSQAVTVSREMIF